MKRNRIGYDRIVRISPLPRAPVFAGVLGPVKNNIIGSCVGRPASSVRLLAAAVIRVSHLPRAPVFAGVLGPVKNNIIGSYVRRPASSVRLLAAAGA